jgi:shikimate dehydrogenase
MDELDPEAAAIGAINTVHFSEGRAVGYNTDAAGFTRTLAEEAGFDFKGKTMLQIGAGGAGHAMVAGAAHAGAARIIIHDVRLQAAADLARHMADHFPNCEFESTGGMEALPEAAADANLIANATPLGMKPADPLPIDEQWIESRHVVFDAVYRPYRTGLLQAATRKGARGVSGLGMLARQGWKSLSIWTGMQPDEELMLRTLKEALEIAD